MDSNLQARRDGVFLVLAGLFLGILGMLNILGLTRFLQLGSIGGWPIVVAYLTAQSVDVRLFHFWKQLTKDKALWLRNNGSTLVSQLVDTSAVVLISHYGAHMLPVQPERSVLPQLISFIGSGYLFKVLAALTDTLPFIWLTGWLREWLDIPGEGGELTTEATSSMH
ncbi:queuosine precursor transporter [Parasynechococcus sp.]|uniref:queuosine precursor transporter n=1 Tax=Parasynechococcus sp. TaxID=3101203 RepID=UPI0037049788